MGSTTEVLRRVLAELGSDASDQIMKAYVRDNYPIIPRGHISLALRKLRGPVRPSMSLKSPIEKEADASQGELFRED